MLEGRVLLSDTSISSVMLYSSNPELQFGQTLKINVLVATSNAGDPVPTGTITLKDENGQVLRAATLSKGQASFSVSALPRGYHWIYAAYSGNSSYSSFVSEQPLSVHVGAKNVVDILALYTDSAALQVDDIESDIYAAVADTNDALLGSRINVSLELVDVARTAYRESGSYRTDLSRLQRKGDGYMDEAFSLRSKYGADLVCLFVGQEESNGTVGLGYVMNGFDSSQAAWAFTEVYIDGAGSPAYTLAHELGHNFGAAHDHANATVDGLYSDSYGYRWQGSDGVYYHDIMSYDGSSRDVTVPLYSNPEVAYRGMPTGKAGYANVARTINISAPIVAAYQPTRVPLATATQTTVSLSDIAYSNLPLTITAKVKALTSNPYTPVGTVTFMDGSVILGTAKVSNGIASWSGALPDTTSHSIRALYQNDDFFGDSLSAAVSGGKSFSVYERARATTVLGSVAVKGGGYSYAIISGNSGGAFVIDPTTGVITVADPAALDYETLKSYRLTVRATSLYGGGVLGDVPVSVSLKNINEAPTAAGVSSHRVKENQAAGTLVGKLLATDPDSGNTFRFSLTGSSGALLAADNASFKIVHTSTGYELRTSAALNFERKSVYSLIIRAKDQGNLFCDTPITISVSNVNERPTSLRVTPASVLENQGATSVGTFATSDPDAKNTFTYKLVSGTGSADNSSFKIVDSQLFTVRSFNYESKKSYSIRVRTTDQGGLLYERSLSISVGNVNEAPSSLKFTLAGDSVPTASGALVGTLSASDPDGATPFTYSLLSTPEEGSSGFDSSLFAIDGNRLVVGTDTLLAGQTYHVLVRVSDPGGLYRDSALTVSA